MEEAPITNPDAEHTYPINIGHGSVIIEPIKAIKELNNKHRLRIRSINLEDFYTGGILTEYRDGALRFTIGKVWPSMYYIPQRA